MPASKLPHHTELKVHGTFRSGSNYIKTLLELNYDVAVNNGGGGFKHAPYPAIFVGNDWFPPKVPVLVTVKNPIAWLTSMWRYVQGLGFRHVECGSTWEAFLVQPLVVFHGGIDGCPKYRFANPIDYWNAMYYNLLSLDGGVRHVVRYEDALHDPLSACLGVAAQFALARSTTEFILVPMRVKNMADGTRSSPDEYVTTKVFDPSYYTEVRYLSAFTDEQLSSVADDLDTDLASRLGYNV